MFESVTLKSHLSVNDKEMLPPMRNAWVLLVEAVEIEITLIDQGKVGVYEIPRSSKWKGIELLAPSSESRQCVGSPLSLSISKGLEFLTNRGGLPM